MQEKEDSNVIYIDFESKSRHKNAMRSIGKKSLGIVYLPIDHYPPSGEVDEAYITVQIGASTIISLLEENNHKDEADWLRDTCMQRATRGASISDVHETALHHLKVADERLYDSFKTKPSVTSIVSD